MAEKSRYKVIRKIDAGGMAEIFVGQASSLEGIHRTVAIKRVRPHLATNRRFIQMFIDEARLCMRLTHANITQVFDVGRAQGTYFLVMELVDGGNLRKIIQLASERDYRIPIEYAVHIVIEVAKGLAHAHEAKDEFDKPLRIVHRDLSPPNILLSKSGEVKVTDFGLAKAKSHIESTDPGVVKGKFSYLCPEATEGYEVDARADIFSLGIVLHELLTGRRLFLGKTDLETVELVRQCNVLPPSAFNPRIDQELDAVVMMALEKDRRKRFQSARDFGDALAKYLFAKNLKVTTFDVSKMVRMLLDDAEVTMFPKRVVEILQEEIINLSSIGALPGTSPSAGAGPLDIEAYRSRRTPFEDIWAEYDGAQHPDTDLSPMGSRASPTPGVRFGIEDSREGSGFAGLVGAGAGPVRTGTRSHISPLVWILAGVGGAGAVMAVLYFIFFRQ